MEGTRTLAEFDRQAGKCSELGKGKVGWVKVGWWVGWLVGEKTCEKIEITSFNRMFYSDFVVKLDFT